MLVTIALDLDVKSCNITDICDTFKQALRPGLEKIVSSVVMQAGQAAMDSGALAEHLGSPCAWKTKTGTRSTKIITEWGTISVPSLQVTTKDDKRRHAITRMVLGLDRWQRTPQTTRQAFAAFAAHCTYRSAQALAFLTTGFKHALGSLQRAAVKIGATVMPGIDHSEPAVYEADGTGIPITHGGKKYEIKVLSQRTNDGKIRIADMILGRTWAGWSKLVKRIKNDRRVAMLVQDGDRGIRAAIAKHGKGISIQICLWHIAHAIKYTLWQDRKSIAARDKKRIKGTVFGRLHQIIEDQARQPMETTEHRLKHLAGFCRRLNMYNTSRYLAMAAPLSQTYRRFGAAGATTSKTERVMGVLNKRIDVGTWSKRGAEAICRLRAAWYYNGWRP